MTTTDNIEILARNQIYVFDEFLSLRECNIILFGIDPRNWSRSRLASSNGSFLRDEEYAAMRNSNTIYHNSFGKAISREVQKIEERVTKADLVKCDRIEGWQITKYDNQEKFEGHIDAGIGVNPEWGDREWTLLVYLMSPEKGGETYF